MLHVCVDRSALEKLMIIISVRNIRQYSGGFGGPQTPPIVTQEENVKSIFLKINIRGIFMTIGYILVIFVYIH